jgi:hypothetical protein
LWSDAERVWLGRATYLEWALRDPEIDIPWVVALATNAPGDAEAFQNAVREELSAYWVVQSARLPSGSKPRWLPLP